MSVETLDASTLELLARAAQSGGGRHAFRVKDAALKEAAKSLADSRRATRRADAQRTRREMKRAESAARVAMLARFNGYASEDVCESAEHTATCCRFGALVTTWKNAPRRATLKRLAIALLREGQTPVEGWRETVRAHRDAQIASAEMGAFTLSRDDMRADDRSRFYRRTVSRLARQYGATQALTIDQVHEGVSYDYGNAPGLDPSASPEDVVQDAFLSALESDAGMTFGGMYRHVSGAVASAGFRYRRMGNRHSDNVSTWTWADWMAWADANGADSLAYSTLEEWQAYDAAKLIHNADAAYRRRVDARREAEATYLDDTRSAWVALLSQGMTVKRICAMLGRNPETVLSELEGDAAYRRV